MRHGKEHNRIVGAWLRLQERPVKPRDVAAWVIRQIGEVPGHELDLASKELARLACYARQDVDAMIAGMPVSEAFARGARSVIVGDGGIDDMDGLSKREQAVLSGAADVRRASGDLWAAEAGIDVGEIVIEDVKGVIAGAVALAAVAWWTAAGVGPAAGVGLLAGAAVTSILEAIDQYHRSDTSGLYVDVDDHCGTTVWDPRWT